MKEKIKLFIGKSYKNIDSLNLPNLMLIKSFSFSKIGLLVILGFGWMEKVFVWDDVPEGIFKMVGTNPITSWMTLLGPMGANYFLGYFELVVFLLLIFKEKYGALLSCIIFIVTLSFLFNGFSFSLVKDITMLGISIDLTLKHWGKNLGVSED